MYIFTIHPVPGINPQLILNHPGIFNSSKFNHHAIYRVIATVKNQLHYVSTKI